MFKTLTLLSILSLILGNTYIANAAEAGQSFRSEEISHANSSFSDFLSNIQTDTDYILVDFWASWCGTCSRTLPFFASINKKFPNLKIKTVAINLDTDSSKAHKLIAKVNTGSLEIYFDPKADLAKIFDIKSMPTSILMDRNGKVITVFEDFSEKGLNKIESSLKELASL